jgi:acetyl esterase/lipase
MIRSMTAGLAAGLLLAATASLAQPAGPRNLPPPVPIAPIELPGTIALYPADAAKVAGAAKGETWNAFAGDPVVRNVTVPTITPFLPDPAKATGAAVVVAPGGGFMLLSIENEGIKVAKWLADQGVAAFLLKYRVQPTPVDPAEFTRAGAARMSGVADRTKRPPAYQPAIDDGIAAVRFVRSQAPSWGVDPKRVGMVGFSAGAMNTLGVTLANQPGARPDFIGLIYGPMFPVEAPADAPPLFAALAADDPLFAGAGYGIVDSWRQAKRPVELHVYQQGGHGFGMLPNNTSTMLWADQFLAWMKTNKIVSGPIK